MLLPFPRAVSLKNGAIAVMEAEVAADRFGPRLDGTPKGDIRHMRPNGDALARMGEGAQAGADPVPALRRGARRCAASARPRCSCA